MVQVRVTDEDLVEEILVDPVTRDVGHRQRTNIEKELVPVSEFDEETGGRLLWTGVGCPVPQAVIRISLAPRTSVPG